MPKPFKHSHILVVGDVMLDRYWMGKTTRVSPEAPVMIVNVKRQKETVGGAANVALNIAALEGFAALMGIIGEDEAGATVDRLLTHDHIQHFLQKSDAHPTITKLRVLSQRQQMIRLDFEDTWETLPKDPLLHHYEKALTNTDMVILSDYGKGTLSDPQAFITRAIQHQKPVLVDPKGQDFDRYRNATLIKPNQQEFEAVVGSCPTTHVLIEKAKQLIQRLSLKGLLITCGENGMHFIPAEGTPLAVAAHSSDLVDVSGAGDTVIATFALALASGYTTEAAMHLSNLAASVVVSKLGTATVSNAELTAVYLKSRILTPGVVTREQLKRAVQDAQAQGKTVVFTNGCFDLLHSGHVTYLEKAKALGDLLIVAINDDASVKRLKGPTRPVSPLASRLAVLAALKSVDWVVPFHEDTPEPLLTLLQPNILVKGGDYDESRIVGADIVHAYGGRVIPIQHDQLHMSSTALIKKCAS